MATPHDARLDELFLRAAGASGGIEPLLVAFFGFLHRKTDFYVVHGGVVGESYAAGFAPGQAERLVLDAFRRYAPKPLAGSGLDREAQEEDVAVVQKETPPPQRQKKRDTNPPAVSSCSAPRPAAPSAAKEDPFAAVRYTEAGTQVPVGNGGVASTHTWTQTLREATVTFEVPPATRAKDVRCRITATALDLAVGDLRVRGAMYDRVDADSSVWTLDRDGASSSGRASIVVTLDKTRETWWASVLKDADQRERIDTTKVDSSKKMDEYDEATQGAIRKIMFDQRQKRRGLPTSDDIKTNELLGQVKHLPGSPFLGGHDGGAGVQASDDDDDVGGSQQAASSRRSGASPTGGDPR